MKSEANKLKISILGDSISTFLGYSEPEGAEFYDNEKKLLSDVISHTDTWWGRTIEALGGELLVNNAISGSTVCGGPRYEYPSYACSDERTSALDRNGVSPDLIFAYIGTNDWGRGTRIHESEEPDPTKRDPAYFFYPAYDMMLSKLKANYPNAVIYCFTPAVSRFTKAPTFAFPYLHGGRHIEEYVGVIRSLSKKHGCRLVDLYLCAEPYETIDGFHPNVDGMISLADTVIAIIKETL
ncbi:MAG: hypothetical protein J5765_02400 [Clostridia bacterium]|nr:hypothetical protein [Clostridia bacterium]